MIIKQNYTKMKKVIILKGLPASGKSTWAKEYVKNNDNVVRVNKDDIRAMMSPKWSKSIESITYRTELECIGFALKLDFDVIVDDTNLNPSTLEKLKEGIKNFGYENVQIEEKFFDTPLSECLERNKKREGRARVPEVAITNMYNKYLKIRKNDK